MGSVKNEDDGHDDQGRHAWNDPLRTSARQNMNGGWVCHAPGVTPPGMAVQLSLPDRARRAESRLSGEKGPLLVFSARLHDLLANPTAHAQADGGFRSFDRPQRVSSPSLLQRGRCPAWIGHRQHSYGLSIGDGFPNLSGISICSPSARLLFHPDGAIESARAKIPTITRYFIGRPRLHIGRVCHSNERTGLRRNHKQITNPWRAGCG